ncbi:TetR/AcrR family transcriptional regulator [Paractinoplanes durhamensis]|uniref:TetR/AcrR family transcriptional regulator n=1 Tax=Paractinoplanes durhamensis TaxID=113563 RepID=UPI0036313BDF
MTSEAATPRVRDAERTRAEIIEVATHEFADQGYAGARVDEIAAKTRTTKRMIYYYFGGKEGLYLTVLEGPTGTSARWSSNSTSTIWRRWTRCGSWPS